MSTSIANILNPTMNSVVANAQASATTNAASTTDTSGLSGTTAGQTFLNLLVKELQNQDPTAPMDSTAMVGQMISLNQLDQLISINQTLGTATSTPASTSGAAAATATESSASVMAARAALLNGSSTLTPAQAATLAASDPSTTLDLTNLNNSFGGK
jgi:flagellar basal-body rod modification protein FlgD